VLAVSRSNIGPVPWQRRVFNPVTIFIDDNGNEEWIIAARKRSHVRSDVGNRRITGLVMLTLSFVGHDP